MNPLVGVILRICTWPFSALISYPLLVCLTLAMLALDPGMKDELTPAGRIVFLISNGFIGVFGAAIPLRYPNQPPSEVEADTFWRRVIRRTAAVLWGAGTIGAWGYMKVEY